MKTLIIIPARAGSKGIPDKNIRFLNGKPLIMYAIENALNIQKATVCISTDSLEIIDLVKNLNLHSVLRPIELSKDDVTLDPVIFHATNEIENRTGTAFDIVITMQPTSPLLSSSTLIKAIEFFYSSGLDTLISCKNDTHLSWRYENGIFHPNYFKRLNRQHLPKSFTETGAFLITRRSCVNENNRIGSRTSVFEVSELESIDIDSYQDWWIAEKYLLRKNILIRTEGFSSIGMGHIYRTLLLASHLTDHNILIVTSKKSDLGIKKLKEKNYNFKVFDSDEELIKIAKEFDTDIFINDILNTSENYIKTLKANFSRVINFEDLGDGSYYADAVINDLYEKVNDKPNFYWGSDYYLIRDQFKILNDYKVNDIVKNVLIVFGGTDPSNLTHKVLNSILASNHTNINFLFILGIGYQNGDEVKNIAEKHKNIEILYNVSNISHYMLQADLAFSSQGRTMLELAFIGVPTIILAQNRRELTHEFGYLQNGFINLGYGLEVEEKTISNTLNWLISSPQVRFQMHKEMKKNDLKYGFDRVKKIILGENI